MNIAKLNNSPYDANAYLVDGTILVDVGMDSGFIISELKKRILPIYKSNLFKLQDINLLKILPLAKFLNHCLQRCPWQERTFDSYSSEFL